jgi:putative salt-induced outer membrane protein
VRDYQARVRYDLLLHRRPRRVRSVSARRDRFQGLDLRLNFDPGLAYYFIDEKGPPLWAELGYDLQYDIRRDEVVDASLLAPRRSKRRKVRHGVRVFAGYDNSSRSGQVQRRRGVPAKRHRDGERAPQPRPRLTSQLNSDFSIATTLSIDYDNNPLPGWRRPISSPR